MANVWYAKPVNVAVNNAAGASPVTLKGNAHSVTAWARQVAVQGVAGTTYEMTCRHDRHGWLNCGMFTVPSA